MSIKVKIKSDIVAATKAKRDSEKNVLKVVMGEVDTQEARSSKQLADEDIYKIIKKTLQGVEEMLHYKPGDATLEEEKIVLKRLLPQFLSQEEISTLLISIESQIKMAKSSGQAMGVSMKYLKENKHLVEASDVTKVIDKMRTI